ncbi:GNAT family N-acetyltransferase [Microbacterium rhizophilus]|uniref:GNAT family N-acetyltransferase n=1 Tax=Microbacterium rhizophilus TaxID=3138934 RepID=UPI0031E973CF
MPLDVRPTTFEDAIAARRLGAEAFGVPSTPPPVPTPGSWPPENVRPWIVKDGDDIAGVLSVRSFTSWFHGARVRTAGIAGVTVAAERRGTGILRPMFAAVLADARQRGEAISTLYPTQAGVYRGVGYEIVGAYQVLRVPMPALAKVRPPSGGTRARRATAEDLAGIQSVYRSWASGHNGPLTREDVPFAMEADEMFGSESTYTGISVAVDGERIVGFVSWTRGTGYDRTGTLEVDDLVAETPDAARALWRVIASFDPVVGSADVPTTAGWSGADPIRLVLPDHAATIVRDEPYMLRILDVEAALGRAILPPIQACVPFAVVDPTTPDIEGSWSLETTGDGSPTIGSDRGENPDRLVFTSAGLAVSYAGSVSTTALRRAGHLTGPTTHDAAWDALWRGRDIHVRDYF